MKKIKKRLLFICLGNICRSPAAEGVMKAFVHHACRDDEFDIDSAGIGNWHVGQLPDPRMCKCGAARGYKFDSRCRQFTRIDFSRFDYIIVMDNENYRAITSMARTAEEREKVVMLTTYLQKYKGAETVPDPYYGDDKDFDKALDLIEDACMGLMEEL
jgi:protein-tyrosine phosphatase